MKRCRRGFTLIELLLAMALFATILTVVAVALGGLARADRNSRDQIHRQQVLQQLILQLRQDVHGADSASVSATAETDAADPEAADPETAADRGAATAQPSLTLVGDLGRTIHFQPSPQGIVRTVLDGDRTLHRESYMWDSDVTATWAIDTTHELPMVLLSLKFNAGPGRSVEQHAVRTTLLNSQTNPVE